MHTLLYCFIKNCLSELNCFTIVNLKILRKPDLKITEQEKKRGGEEGLILLLKKTFTKISVNEYLV